MRQRVPGVRHVHERGFSKNTLELAISVERQQDVTFKGNVPAQLAGLNLGRFEMVARDGEIIYLRRVGGTASRTGAPGSGESTSLNTSPQPASEPQHGRGAAPPPEAPSPRAPAPPPPPSPTYQRGYRKSWAVVIGINEYQKWPKLKHAVNDARSVGDVLRKIGFDEIIMLLDGEATQQNIRRVLGDELYDKTQDEDRVLIFFAGHGQTQDLPNNRKTGYIIPVEGELNNYYSTAISMHQLQELSDRVRAKHMLFALDSCFSGLLRLRGGGLDAYDAMASTTAPVRRCSRPAVKGSRWLKSQATASSPGYLSMVSRMG